MFSQHWIHVIAWSAGDGHICSEVCRHWNIHWLHPVSNEGLYPLHTKIHAQPTTHTPRKRLIRQLLRSGQSQRLWMQQNHHPGWSANTHEEGLPGHQHDWCTHPQDMPPVYRPICCKIVIWAQVPSNTHHFHSRLHHKKGPENLYRPVINIFFVVPSSAKSSSWLK